MYSSIQTQASPTCGPARPTQLAGGYKSTSLGAGPPDVSQRPVAGRKTQRVRERL